MPPSFCNVALPVPLRTTFTYAVPASMRGTVPCGSRVLVPFRSKSLIGVVVDFVEKAPEGAKVREVTRVLDFVPALTPKLMELARWIAQRDRTAKTGPRSHRSHDLAQYSGVRRRGLHAAGERVEVPGSIHL